MVGGCVVNSCTTDPGSRVWPWIHCCSDGLGGRAEMACRRYRSESGRATALLDYFIIRRWGGAVKMSGDVDAGWTSIRELDYGDQVLQLWTAWADPAGIYLSSAMYRR